MIRLWLQRKEGSEYHIDHILPLSLDGPHCYENLRILPGSENLSKHARYPTDEELEIVKILEASRATL
jgi:5-methylcytosine-specific restriction endonuclease McrA